MGALIPGDDGLLLEADVGDWVDEKHWVLATYLDYHAAPRAGFIGPGTAGATYIDLFCGPGRAKIKDSSRFVDGSAVLAWKRSREKRAPFTALYIADKDEQRRELCAARLRRLNAPVIPIEGEAVVAARRVVATIDPYGLHFAFLDPYSLGALQLKILQTLAGVRRMDMLVHLSAMDLFRNLDKNVARERREFDAFAPNWHEHIAPNLPREEQRRAVIEYWKTLVDALGMDAGAEMHAIRNSVNRDLYWLLLVTRHELAKKFWKIVLDSQQQRRLI